MQKKENWSEIIKRAELFFSKNKIPARMKIDNVTIITNPELFLESHLAAIKKHNGKRAYLPYLERLITVAKLLKTNK